MIALLLMTMACTDKDPEIHETADPGEPATFSEVRDEILLLSCAFSSCHGDQGAGDLTLSAETAHEALVDIPSSDVPGETLVIPGNAAGSYLIKKLEEADGIAGDVMPPGSSLPDPKIETIRSWIDNGAQDD